MGKYTVSLIIPAYNMKEELYDCLVSVRRQTYKDFETVVVDDASSDGTGSMLKDNFPEVVLVRNSVNIGPEASRNRAILASSAAYIASLDADTKVENTWLEELVRAIDSDRRIGMCSCRILQMSDPRLVDNIGHALYYDFSPIHIAQDEKDGSQFDTARKVFGVCLAGALIKKEVFCRAGLFDESYVKNFGDEWTWRARLAGYLCVYAPAAVMCHRRDRTRTLDRSLIFIWERNRVWSLLKYYPWEMLAISVFYTVKRLAVSLCAYPLKKPGALPAPAAVYTVLYAWIKAMLQLSVLLGKRKREQPRSRARTLRPELSKEWSAR